MVAISAKGIALIKVFEGFSAKAYRCPANVPTIGYGTTRYPDGRPVKDLEMETAWLRPGLARNWLS